MHSAYFRQVTAFGVVHQMLDEHKVNKESSAPSTPHLPAVSGAALRRALASSRASRGGASTCLTKRHVKKIGCNTHDFHWARDNPRHHLSVRRQSLEAHLLGEAGLRLRGERSRLCI